MPVLALNPFLNPQWLIPAVAVVLVGLLTFLGGPLTRQRAVHEADLIEKLKVLHLDQAAEDVSKVLQRRVRGWAAFRFRFVVGVVAAIMGAALIYLVIALRRGQVQVPAEFSAITSVGVAAAVATLAKLASERARRSYGTTVTDAATAGTTDQPTPPDPEGSSTSTREPQNP